MRVYRIEDADGVGPYTGDVAFPCSMGEWGDDDCHGIPTVEPWVERLGYDHDDFMGYSFYSPATHKPLPRQELEAGRAWERWKLIADDERGRYGFMSMEAVAAWFSDPVDRDLLVGCGAFDIVVYEIDEWWVATTPTQCIFKRDLATEICRRRIHHDHLGGLDPQEEA
jgi:hypothetical protein